MSLTKLMLLLFLIFACLAMMDGDMIKMVFNLGLAIIVKFQDFTDELFKAKGGK
jgi:hypothetical protein